MDDVVGVAIGLVVKHPAVRSVEFAGSRSRGTHQELSDWDFAVQTSDFAAVARDLPTLVEPLDPLGAQWEPMGHFPVYQVFLRGPTKIEYLFLDHAQEAMPPLTPSETTLVAMNTLLGLDLVARDEGLGRSRRSGVRASSPAPWPPPATLGREDRAGEPRRGDRRVLERRNALEREYGI